MLATVRACWRSPRAVPVGLRNSICSIQRHHCDSFRPSLRAQHSPAQRRGNASGRPNAAAGSAEPAEVEAFILPALETEAQVEQERKWLRQIITSWLDEEWTPLEVHAALGAAAADSYIDIRRNGDDDVSSIVLSLSSRLLAFNYRDTFVNAFDVANKVVEVLMLRAGCDVCCTSDDDRERVQRHRQPADAAASAQ